ncbi:putative RNA binding protein Pym [Aspergillus homomorphus CBS 101889]|uniref:WIBG Mago-binding domain-containing protein n=1 Tax=Aspergillus homomorphus (strain CBS 101889) TaxID=1450537 RepID=A0A395IAS7_ASPHC|nr:hypothetical protein BO97DRAFT_439242 [Aspergillus homomorphus CBS 101889]RAL17277.1 hypothetical protein BO97DRAFT_439242 [Aspergillus homomorphus CBS 101889]
MASNKTGGVTSSGIATNESTGERYIPSSTRADGSKRREIRVRPGYRPPEDVELYKNRAAEAWKNRGKTGGGVPGAEGLKPSAEDSGSAASNKNAKRREARKKAKATQDSAGATKDVTQIENWRAAAAAPNGAAKKEADSSGAAKQPTEEALDPEAENEKKARNLKKKLRQARDLRDKKNQGEALLPEQLEKVIKIQELVRQLDALGFDANGDKKDASAEEEKDTESAKLHPRFEFDGYFNFQDFLADAPSSDVCTARAGIIDLCPCISLTARHKFRIARILADLHKCEVLNHPDADIALTTILNLNAGRNRLLVRTQYHVRLRCGAQLPPSMQPFFACPHRSLLYFAHAGSWHMDECLECGAQFTRDVGHQWKREGYFTVTRDLGGTSWPPDEAWRVQCRSRDLAWYHEFWKDDTFACHSLRDLQH